MTRSSRQLINYLTAEYGLARGLTVGEHAAQPFRLLLGLQKQPVSE
jgi:hypothetical protein